MYKIVQVNKQELFKKVLVANIRKRIKAHKYQFIYRRTIKRKDGDLLEFAIYNNKISAGIAHVWVKQLG